jgi:hypothetical protein
VASATTQTSSEASDVGMDQATITGVGGGNPLKCDA